MESNSRYNFDYNKVIDKILIDLMLNTYDERTNEYKMVEYLEDSNLDIGNNRDNFRCLLKKCQNKLIIQEFIRKLKPEYFITITTNRNISKKQLKEKTNQFLQTTNRLLFGRKYFKRDKHLNGIGVLESKNGRIHNHYHLLINNLENIDLDRLKTVMKKSSMKIKFNGYRIFNFDSGIDIKRIFDLSGITHYLTKENQDFSNILLLNKGGLM
ncbi:hypothetical protein [Seleniivibrio woodruffii]|uniref:hypothetical protein n=1 Tax=Seleniivibrio woodruffii TaxID=1078050 RepID=UPI0024095DA0|nr:hypothetical protein [Seleniivibrio woodruffii]